MTATEIATCYHVPLAAAVQIAAAWNGGLIIESEIDEIARTARAIALWDDLAEDDPAAGTEALRLQLNDGGLWTALHRQYHVYCDLDDGSEHDRLMELAAADELLTLHDLAEADDPVELLHQAVVQLTRRLPRTDAAAAGIRPLHETSFQLRLDDVESGTWHTSVVYALTRLEDLAVVAHTTWTHVEVRHLESGGMHTWSIAGWCLPDQPDA